MWPFKRINRMYFNLDKVLKAFKENTAENPIVENQAYWHAKILFNISNREKEAIKHKLLTDKYITEVPKGEYMKQYFISLDGYIFIEEGGYVKKEKGIRFNKRYKAVTGLFLFMSSIIGGIWAFFQILKFFYPTSFPQTNTK